MDCPRVSSVLINAQQLWRARPGRVAQRLLPTSPSLAAAFLVVSLWAAVSACPGEGCPGRRRP